jgi:hypothetical protein
VSGRIVRGMDAAAYHADPALGSGSIRELNRSAKHFAAYRDGSGETTPAMRLGSLAHVATLEPSLWEAAYRRNIEGDGRTKVVKEARAELEAAARQDGYFIVNPDDYDTATAIARSVRAHPAAAGLLRYAVDFEVSLFWEDETNGAACKGRIDFVAKTPAGIVLCDLKTTSDASEDAAARTIVAYGLDGQAAHYIDGYETATGEKVAAYALVFVESAKPHDVLVRTIGDLTLDRGRTRRMRALDLWAECTASGRWPGRDEKISSIDAPAWAL